MNKEYKHGNRNKYLLRYHLILVCKYRRHLLSVNNISTDIKILTKDISDKHNVQIHYMEVDKDHLHIMIETTPNIQTEYRKTLSKRHLGVQGLYIILVLLFVLKSTRMVTLSVIKKLIPCSQQ